MSQSSPYTAIMRRLVKTAHEEEMRATESGLLSLSGRTVAMRLLVHILQACQIERIPEEDALTTVRVLLVMERTLGTEYVAQVYAWTMEALIDGPDKGDITL